MSPKPFFASNELMEIGFMQLAIRDGLSILKDVAMMIYRSVNIIILPLLQFTLIMKRQGQTF